MSVCKWTPAFRCFCKDSGSIADEAVEWKRDTTVPTLSQADQKWGEQDLGGIRNVCLRKVKDSLINLSAPPLETLGNGRGTPPSPPFGIPYVKPLNLELEASSDVSIRFKIP